MHDKEYYIDLRNKYKPSKIKIIFLLESPPASGKYFYDPDGRTSEPLFSAMMKVIGHKPAIKQDGLAAFSIKGLFLVDATYRPVNHIRNNRQRNVAILSDLPELIEDLKRTIKKQRVKIVLVKANICRLLEEPLTAAGFNVLNDRTVILFPSSGNQNKFHQTIQKLLTQKRIRMS